MFRPGYPHESYWARFVVATSKGTRVHNLVFSGFCYHSFEGELSTGSMLTPEQLGGQDYQADFTLTIGETDLRSFLANPGLTVLTKLFSSSDIEMVGDKLEFLKFLSFIDKN